VKLALIYVGSLLAIAALALLVGPAPSQAHWGHAGVESMRFAVGICFIAALIAAIPALVAAAFRSPHSPQLCLGGTVIRLLITAMLAMAYQSFFTVHLRSFLIWLLIAYMAYLAVETAFSVYIVRRRWSPPASGRPPGADAPR
jgi:hypothetical protein